MCCCERSFVTILFRALALNSFYMPSSLSQRGFLGAAPSAELHWFHIRAIILQWAVINSQVFFRISTNEWSNNWFSFVWFHSAATEAWRCMTLNWGLLTLFIVEPWRFLSAAARHLSLARAWFATGSTAGQETCNYNSLQRCQSVKDSIHAFILANPSPFLFFCLLTFPPPAPMPFFLLSHQPSSLFRWAIKQRNKCKWSLVWHRSLLTHSLLKYPPA